MAYDKALWQKLPINLVLCQVPVGIVRHILKLGTAYLSLRLVEIVGDPIQLCEANTLNEVFVFKKAWWKSSKCDKKSVDMLHPIRKIIFLHANRI